MERFRRFYTVEESNSESSLRIWRSAVFIVLVIETLLLIYQIFQLILDERHNEDWKNPTFVVIGCSLALIFLIFGVFCCKFENVFLLIHLFCYQAALTVINCSLLVSITIFLIYFREYFIHALEEYLKQKGYKETVTELLVFQSLFYMIWFLYRSIATFAVYKYYASRKLHRELLTSYEPVDMHSTVY